MYGLKETVKKYRTACSLPQMSNTQLEYEISHQMRERTVIGRHEGNSPPPTVRLPGNLRASKIGRIDECIGQDQESNKRRA